MLIAGFPAGSFAANCYIVASEPGAECLIIDPGQDAEPGIEEIVGEVPAAARSPCSPPTGTSTTSGRSLRCAAPGTFPPISIRPTGPCSAIQPAACPLLAGQQLFGGMTFTEPDDVLELADGMTLDLAGISLVVDHAPGHTPGSVAFRLPDTMFTGDLLFAGSIGRTDLPGGDYQTMLDSLARVCLPLPDETVVLSGHGPQTTIGAERASNPFLAGLAPASGPSRGL